MWGQRKRVDGKLSWGSRTIPVRLKRKLAVRMIWGVSRSCLQHLEQPTSVILPPFKYLLWCLRLSFAFMEISALCVCAFWFTEVLIQELSFWKATFMILRINNAIGITKFFGQNYCRAIFCENANAHAYHKCSLYKKCCNFGVTKCLEILFTV